MTPLSSEFRKQLGKAVMWAREAAERGARKALKELAVHEPEPYKHLSEEQRLLRRALRAQARQLGDEESRDKKGAYEITHLQEKVAYDQWHRLLFARFLIENNLLLSPEHGVAVTLADCEELAPGLGLRDGWGVAARFAAAELPEIFRADDPAGRIELPAEDRKQLVQLVTGLPVEVFLADDALGWVYQFWQAKRKDEVNESGKKIGADELAPVTQLFTEDYMVLFLLHNTLGAWWAGKQRVEWTKYETEEDCRQAVALPGVEWTYLRFVKNDKGEWCPAAGTYDGWPKTAKEVRVLDPCMGSGHFLVAELPILVALRMAEEGLTKEAAVVAVLRDNLYGLELDQRCTQIAAFNLAMAAWKLAGWQRLPSLNLACSGLAPRTKMETWVGLAGDNLRLQGGMERLYALFKEGPILGSLINPRKLGGDLLTAEFHELQPLLKRALEREDIRTNETVHELAVTAKGLAHAAEILADQFTLVATNVPYLGRGKQDDVLKAYCERVHPHAKADLATCFVERCLEFCAQSGSTALVTPQNWLFLGTYKHLRKRLLETVQWDGVAKLGSHAFDTIGGEVVNVALVSMSRRQPNTNHVFACVETSSGLTAESKSVGLRAYPPHRATQRVQLENPDAIVTCESSSPATRLKEHANSNQGVGTADANRFVQRFWETWAPRAPIWEFYQMAPERTGLVSGCHSILRWEGGKGALASSEQARVCGQSAWGKHGVAIAVTHELYRSYYPGGMFDCTLAAVTPQRALDARAVIAFVLSDEFPAVVRRVDQALSVTESSFLKVPFDLVHWQKVAAERYPNGLPKPFSSDPTQWLFNGHPKGSDQPLQVAVARLLGYRWPRQTGSTFPDCPALGPDGLDDMADRDGIVCLSSTQGEVSAAERLRAVLAAAYRENWSAGRQAELLAQVDYAGQTLEDWLRNGFFEQHCALFHHRPFIWHIWDGRKDGFSALVNYHTLNRVNLEKLTFSYLGDWTRRQQAAVEAGEAGSDARLLAARQLQDELKKILEGEAPYDIFVRWKPLEQQPVGWEPDLNDGVRLNIRPFMSTMDVGKKGAGILRAKPNIHWNKDRGKDVPNAPWFKVFKGERINDHHLALDEKRRARRHIEADERRAN